MPVMALHEFDFRLTWSAFDTAGVLSFEKNAALVRDAKIRLIRLAESEWRASTFGGLRSFRTDSSRSKHADVTTYLKSLAATAKTQSLRHEFSRRSLKSENLCLLKYELAENNFGFFRIEPSEGGISLGRKFQDVSFWPADTNWKRFQVWKSCSAEFNSETGVSCFLTEKMFDAWPTSLLMTQPLGAGQLTEYEQT